MLFLALNLQLVTHFPSIVVELFVFELGLPDHAIEMVVGKIAPIERIGLNLYYCHILRHCVQNRANPHREDLEDQ